MKLERIQEPLADEEIYLHRRIEMLKRDFEAAAKPFFDRLAEIESLKTPRYMVVYEDGDVPHHVKEFIKGYGQILSIKDIV